MSSKSKTCGAAPTRVAAASVAVKEVVTTLLWLPARVVCHREPRSSWPPCQRLITHIRLDCHCGVSRHNKCQGPPEALAPRSVTSRWNFENQRGTALRCWVDGHRRQSVPMFLEQHRNHSGVRGVVCHHGLVVNWGDPAAWGQRNIGRLKAEKFRRAAGKTQLRNQGDLSTISPPDFEFRPAMSGRNRRAQRLVQ
jgi:hypothetical protein